MLYMLLVWTIIALVAFPSGILSASPQFCGNSFGPSLKVKKSSLNASLSPTDCTNPDGRLIYAELTLVATPSLNRDISMPLATTLVEGTDAVGTMKTLSTSAGLVSYSPPEMQQELVTNLPAS
ncbi:hypothetical protein PSTT_06815 [Puccinia striiformis]|uniref:Uncharacterized protein n=1 Tax=Puccinia striiformis TaxID=27350 RepID=A0A2S4VIS5_9BASI|nr:hypothetical protein PSTT_06815 [Puccinia striiformis]